MSYSQNLRQWKVVFEASLFFGNWAEAWKTIIHSSKTITCAYVDLGHQSSCVLRRKLFNVFRMREANGKTFFFINRCVERLRGKNKQVSVPGFFCCCLHRVLNKLEALCSHMSVHFVFHGSIKLSSRQHYDFPNKRVSHRFLQNHCFICVFFSGSNQVFQTITQTITKR